VINFLYNAEIVIEQTKIQPRKLENCTITSGRRRREKKTNPENCIKMKKEKNKKLEPINLNPN